MTASTADARREMVRLNVGGRVFITTRTTLSMSSESSFFTVLLSGKFTSTTDDTGAFFIDRNGDLFAPILDFMRTGKLFVPPSVNTDAVYNEAEYYQIHLPDRPPPQPQQQPNIHDYLEVAVHTNSGWSGSGTWVSVTTVSVVVPPIDSDLKELMSSMPLQQLGTAGLANVATYIEAHSAWRVKNWILPSDKHVQIYLFKTSS
ncbi:K+ channel tetramerization subfamily protein [Pelomyxa schiedti]|nr:K+ channel tetramerization subfamily protein [Pelomyxa schiedti]